MAKDQAVNALTRNWKVSVNYLAGNVVLIEDIRAAVEILYEAGFLIEGRCGDCAGLRTCKIQDFLKGPLSYCSQFKLQNRKADECACLCTSCRFLGKYVPPHPPLIGACLPPEGVIPTTSKDKDGHTVACTTYKPIETKEG